MHFEVYENLAAATGGGTRVATSQVALPEAACDEVYATAGYEQSLENMAQLTLQSDNVFGDDAAASQLGFVDGDVTSGYTVELTVRSTRRRRRPAGPAAQVRLPVAEGGARPAPRRAHPDGTRWSGRRSVRRVRATPT